MDLNIICRIKLINFIRDVQSKTSHKFLKTLTKTLIKEQNHVAFPTNPRKYIQNLSNKKLRRIGTGALSLGFKFHIPKKCNRRDTETQFEYLYQQLSDLKPMNDVKQSWFKSKLVDNTNQYVTTPITQSKLFTKDQYQALGKLIKDETIMLLRPDKGSGVVILNRDEYINKVTSILNDSTRFIIDNTQKDSTDATEKRLLRMLRELLKKNLIDNHTYNELKPKALQLPYLYGLPKSHKHDIPIRPILSVANSPFHKLARWLTKCLEPIRN
ncbi:unnamed protein product [Schistosoma mattheei]|uniref:Uncharacterized protein n=1 Tax=Schistosoma mattheei TaxID=31246 RepID=A0A183Q0A0_9TREM|nr:unnamed protein product [Schistosoma mattheei]